MERNIEGLNGVMPTKEQATSIMERALKVLHYRDKSTYNKWSMGHAEEVNIFARKILLESNYII